MCLWEFSSGPSKTLPHGRPEGPHSPTPPPVPTLPRAAPVQPSSSLHHSGHNGSQCGANRRCTNTSPAHGLAAGQAHRLLLLVLGSLLCILKGGFTIFQIVFLMFQPPALPTPQHTAQLASRGISEASPHLGGGPECPRPVGHLRGQPSLELL